MRDTPEPFIEIETELLNDNSDQSSIALDGIILGSCNEWECCADQECPIQNEIHSTIERAAQILRDYRDGKLSYNA
jgi:hypothetical protein